ncbi:hypothetical protein M758_UG158300 [Ceratodon purpureus]|nr:hypothetical protein M758_UG158300 [Ceratodon purpureus]
MQASRGISSRRTCLSMCKRSIVNHQSAGSQAKSSTWSINTCCATISTRPFFDSGNWAVHRRSVMVTESEKRGTHRIRRSLRNVSQKHEKMQESNGGGRAQNLGLQLIYGWPGWRR